MCRVLRNSSCVLCHFVQVEEEDGGHWTPLLRVAAVRGHKSVAECLLRRGANINRTDETGQTALMVQ